MLVNMLVMWGRLEDARFQTTVGQQLFPEDPHFRLMQGVVAAASGEANPAAILDDVSLTEAERQAWKDVYRLINELISITSDARTDTRTRITARLLQTAGSLKVVADFGWRVPPLLAEQFAAVQRSLLFSGGQAEHPARTALRSLLNAHPEGMLFVLLGEFQIADGDLEAGRDTFLEVVAPD